MTVRPDEALAFDRDSVRTYKDGHLHVEISNISKATVNEYLGREIPDYDALGLDPGKRYRLLRDPEELTKAAGTFNNLPLLSRHVPITADSHPKELVIGSTGTDAKFEAPYLRNSLVVWPREEIDAIESDKKKELSSAYRYRADMTPGTFEGQNYDGVMRDIVGNHVALVREGRAGPDVVVGDSAIPKLQEIFQMSKVVLSRKAAVAHGAVLALLRPKLAQDAKIDLTPVFDGVSAKNFKDKAADIAKGIAKATKGKLAQDADMKDIAQMLDALGDVEVAEGADADPSSGLPMTAEQMSDKAMDDDPIQKLKALLAGKVDDATMEAIEKILGAGKATDAEPPPFKGEPKVGTGPAKDADPDKDKEKDKDMVTKTAMDEAIKAGVAAAEARVLATQKAIAEAVKAVRPYVGELAMAHDSAEGVYRTALTALGVKVDGLHPDALPSILAVQPKLGDKKSAPETVVAMDAAASEDFAKRFPHAAKIGTI